MGTWRHFVFIPLPPFLCQIRFGTWGSDSGGPSCVGRADRARARDVRLPTFGRAKVPPASRPESVRAASHAAYCFFRFPSFFGTPSAPAPGVRGSSGALSVGSNFTSAAFCAAHAGSVARLVHSYSSFVWS